VDSSATRVISDRFRFGGGSSNLLAPVGGRFGRTRRSEAGSYRYQLGLSVVRHVNNGMRSDLSIGFEGCAVASCRIDYAGAPRLLVGGDLRLSHT
jgi:hypothetical protein